MKTYILLLRGINVGGHRKLLMADLKKLLSNLGLLNVQTYIQSGNVVFQMKEKIIESEIEIKVSKQILDDYGYQVPIIILSEEKLRLIISDNPFVQEDNLKDLHCTFFETEPKNLFIEEFNTIDFDYDQVLVTKNALYLCCGLKYTDTKLSHTMMEKKLNVSCTTRNWKTTLKLLAMV